MKKSLRHVLLLAGLLLAPGVANADVYTLDPMHTSVTWSINHFGFSDQWGKFVMIEGQLELDEQNPQASKLTVTVPVATGLVTGLPKLDDHVRSKEFLDVGHYPSATFTSTKVTQTGQNTATVEGNLSLLGVTRPETLYVTLNKIGENMMKKKTAGFSATATIKRSDFGMTSFLPMLGDEVKLFITTEANI